MAAKLGPDGIAELMRRYLEEDGAKKSLVVEGRSVEEALADAAVQRGVPLKRLEFEVVEKGSPGVMGAGRKPWRVRAYPAAKKREAAVAVAQAEAEIEAAPVEALMEKDEDGECFVRLSPDGALLKVTSPRGRGRRVGEKKAQDKLMDRAVRNFDEALVKEVVKQASGEYVRVGEFIANPANDALMTGEITDQEMKAFVMLTPPGPGGSDLSKDAVLAFLRNNRVVHGVIDEALTELEDRPRYREPRLVAEGSNMSTTIEGVDAFVDAGIFYAPGKASNAGGVATSGLEMTQNSMRLSWTREEVDKQLRGIMKNIHSSCVKAAEAYGKPGNYVVGANIAGFKKVADAMIDQGLV